MHRKLVGGNPPQVETLATGQDGDRDLVDFGGGEEELHMLPEEQALPAETEIPARSSWTSWLALATPGIA